MFDIEYITESDPVCKSKIINAPGFDIILEGDSVQLECTIVYIGAWTPVMTWKRIGVRDTINPVQEHIVTSGRSQVKSKINVTANTSTHGNVYKCTTHFDQLTRDQSGVNATNVPDYTFSSEFVLNITRELNQLFHCHNATQTRIHIFLFLKRT